MTVIFDLDGTLTKKDTYIPFLGLCIKEFKIRNLSLLSLPFYSLLYYIRIISNHTLKQHFLKKTLAGFSVKQIEPLAERFVSQLLISGLNRKILSRLNDHLQQGHSVIMATASFDFYVLKLAEKLQIPEVICTHAEVNDGMLTGRILGRNCHGFEKAKRLKETLSHQNGEDIVVYTDHYSDFPLIMGADKCFLVNPNVITRYKLRKYNFTVIG